MDSNEFLALHAQAQAIQQADVHLGRFLMSLVLHLAKAHGLDPDVLLAPPSEVVEEEASKALEAPVEEVPVASEPEAAQEGA